MSTHEPEQAVSNPAHPDAHLPCEHTIAAGHALPHAPQFFASDVVSAHWPEHVLSPAAQPHTLFWHTWPAGQPVPHAPQFAALLVRSTHAPPHAFVPGAHPASGLVAASGTPVVPAPSAAVVASQSVVAAPEPAACDPEDPAVEDPPEEPLPAAPAVEDPAAGDPGEQSRLATMRIPIRGSGRVRAREDTNSP